MAETRASSTAGSSTEDYGGSGITTRSRLVLFAWLAPLTVVLDHLAKLWAVETLRSAPISSYLGDTLRLQYSENAGAFLGLGSSLAPETRFWLFTVAVGALLVVLLGLLFRSSHLRRAEAVGLTLIAAGGFSNWVDRLVNEGVVIDFLNVGIGSLRTGIFNLADMAITGGVIYLAVLAMVTPQSGAPDSSSEE